MRNSYVLTAICIILAASMVAAENRAPLVERPTVAVEWTGCVTGECHVNIKAGPRLHGPVNVDSCDACHQVASVAEHSFTLTRAPEQLCGFCHLLELDKPVVHEPLRQGQCLGCHDPHGGTDVRFLRAGTLPSLCHGCHENVLSDKQHVHGPVAAGACDACHAPHAAAHPNLLPATGRDLCVSCHVEMDQQLRQITFVHEPVRGDCADCHDPHASQQPMMVRQPLTTLCIGCHESVGTTIREATYQHSPVTVDSSCANCHTAHGSALRGLMKKQPAAMCLECHAEPVHEEGRRSVAAVPEVADENLVRHGPAAEGTCSGCHDVHGANVSRLLVKPYPEAFYSPFELEKFELCFSCHDAQLVLQPQTDGLTSFRNEKTNLHYVHVNKENRGRTCRACHNTHASTNPLHIRETVPFGNWALPINFTRTETGGSCAPGCHQAMGYDRSAKIDNTVVPPPLDAAVRKENP